MKKTKRIKLVKHIMEEETLPIKKDIVKYYNDLFAKKAVVYGGRGSGKIWSARNYLKWYVEHCEPIELEMFLALIRGLNGGKKNEIQ